MRRLPAIDEGTDIDQHRQDSPGNDPLFIGDRDPTEIVLRIPVEKTDLSFVGFPFDKMKLDSNP